MDLAWTLVLMGDPGAAQALARADTYRPEGVAAGHTLDAVRDYLAARLDAPGVSSAGAPAVKAALARLVQQQGRRAHSLAGPGLGSFAGAFN